MVLPAIVEGARLGADGVAIEDADARRALHDARTAEDVRRWRNGKRRRLQRDADAQRRPDHGAGDGIDEDARARAARGDRHGAGQRDVVHAIHRRAADGVGNGDGIGETDIALDRKGTGAPRRICLERQRIGDANPHDRRAGGDRGIVDDGARGDVLVEHVGRGIGPRGCRGLQQDVQRFISLRDQIVGGNDDDVRAGRARGDGDCAGEQRKIHAVRGDGRRRVGVNERPRQRVMHGERNIRRPARARDGEDDRVGAVRGLRPARIGRGDRDHGEGRRHRVVVENAHSRRVIRPVVESEFARRKAVGATLVEADERRRVERHRDGLRRLDEQIVNRRDHDHRLRRPGGEREPAPKNAAGHRPRGRERVVRALPRGAAHLKKKTHRGCRGKIVRHAKARGVRRPRGDFRARGIERENIDHRQDGRRRRWRRRGEGIDRDRSRRGSPAIAGRDLHGELMKGV